MVIAILVSVGIVAINNQVVVEIKQSSFKLTDFEYVVRSPWRSQVAEFDKNTDAVNKTFPCTSVATVCHSESASPELHLLYTDDIDDYGISLFTEKTLVSGSFDKNGIMLDETAARKLGVSVGDEISYSIISTPVTLKVAAIYRASTYETLEDGIALVSLTDDMKAAFGKELPYTLCFIDAKDEAKCAAMLASYKPLAQVKTEAEYTEWYNEKNSKMPGTTDEEWAELIADEYDKYFKEMTTILKTEGNVERKSDFMEDIDDRNKTTQSKVDALTVGIAVAAAVAYSLIAVVLMFRGMRDDVILASEGAEKSHLLRTRIAVNTIFPILVTVAAAGILAGYAEGKGFLDISIPIIALCSLPVLASIPVSALASVKYVNTVYGKSESSEDKGMIHVSEDGEIAELIEGTPDGENKPADAEDKPADAEDKPADSEGNEGDTETSDAENADDANTELKDTEAKDGEPAEAKDNEGEEKPALGADTESGENSPVAQTGSETRADNGETFPDEKRTSNLPYEGYIPSKKNNSISKIIIGTEDIGNGDNKD